MLCEHDLQARHALEAHLVSVARLAKLSQNQFGWYGFSSRWMGSYVFSMGLHGRVRMKPKQTAELLLRPLRKQLHLPGWTPHHTPYKPFMVVAQRPAATSQAMPAPFLYLMQSSSET